MKSISRMRRYWMSIIFARRRLDSTPRGSRLAYEPISRSFSRPQRKRERRESKEGEWAQRPLRCRRVLEADPRCLPKHGVIASEDSKVRRLFARLTRRSCGPTYRYYHIVEHPRSGQR